MIVEEEEEILRRARAGRRGAGVGALFVLEEALDERTGEETSVDRGRKIDGEFVADFVEGRQVEDGLVQEEFDETTLLR